MSSMSDTERFLLAVGAGLAFSLACLIAALQAGAILCARVALGCPTLL